MTRDGGRNELQVVTVEEEEGWGNASTIFVSEMWLQPKTH